MKVLPERLNYTDDMAEISGFGGDYEEACREMVIAGVRHLDEKEGPELAFREYEGVFGVFKPEGEDAERLQDAMIEAIDDPPTGAMLHACIRHAVYIHSRGWKEYAYQMIDRNDG